MSLKNKRIVFAPGCMLCPSFQVDPSEKNMAWPKEIVPFLLQNNIGIIPMPCPEISFGGYIEGAARLPHGVTYYEKQIGFVEHCGLLGSNVAHQIHELSQAGFHILAVIGIERSPTCAASFLRTQKGTEKRQGIFMSVISRELEEMRLNIPIVGINRSSSYSRFFRVMSLLLENG